MTRIGRAGVERVLEVELVAGRVVLPELRLARERVGNGLCRRFLGARPHGLPRIDTADQQEKVRRGVAVEVTGQDLDIGVAQVRVVHDARTGEQRTHSGPGAEVDALRAHATYVRRAVGVVVADVPVVVGLPAG